MQSSSQLLELSEQCTFVIFNFNFVCSREIIILWYKRTYERQNKIKVTGYAQDVNKREKKNREPVGNKQPN